MADQDAPRDEAEATLTADQIAGRTFPTSRKGLDPREVRSFLEDVAQSVRAANDREEALRGLVEEAQAQLRRLQDEAARVAAEPVDETKLASAEAVRILTEARAEAERIVAAASASAATEAENRRNAAASRVLEQEARANRVRKTAQEEAEAIRARARNEGDAVIEAARDRGREMVGEAQAARERILTDLTKRKRTAQAQLDQLYVASERLLETLRLARRGIDELSIRFEASAEGVQPGRRLAQGAAPAEKPGPTTPSGSSGSTGGGPASPRGAGGGATSSSAAPRPNPTPWQPRRPEPPAPRPPAAGPPPASTEPATAVATPARAGVGEPRADDPSTVRAPTSSPPATAPARAEGAGTPPRDERRSSSLRILRRGRAASVPPGERPELPTVRPPDVTEGVRIIGVPRAGRIVEEAASAAPSDVAPPDVEAAAPEAAASQAAGPMQQAAPEIDVVPEAATEPEPPTAAAEGEPVPVPAEVEAEPAPTAESPVVEAPVAIEPAATDHPQAPEPEPEPSTTAREGSATSDARPRIEELFARIRADREQAVTKANAVLADSAEDAQTPEPEPEPEAGRTAPTPTPTPTSPEPRTRSAQAPTASRSPLSGIGPAAQAPKSRRATPESPRSHADERLLQQRDEVIDPLGVQLVRRLKRTMQDDQNGALDRLRTARAGERTAAVLGDRDEQAAPYFTAGQGLLDEAARAGSSSTPFGAAPVAVDDLAMALAREVCDGLRGRLERALEEATREDLDLSGISERLSAIYREMKLERLDRLAAHHLVTAYSRGAFVSTQEGRPLRWIVDDEAACPDCDDNALAGPTPRGEAFPTGQLHPPVHLGCRCLVVSGPA